MALVPFRVSGAAADQTLEHRLFQIGHHTVRIDQDVHSSGSLQRVGIQRESKATSDYGQEHLEHVGLVVWQSAFVLAEYLLRHPPFGQWHDVRAVDLGAGTGVTGIALAMAGASVTMTDLPHITQLTEHNLQLNLGSEPCHAKVIAHCWGEDVAPLMPPPDLIIGADVVYQQEHFDSLISTLQHLAAPHTLVYLAFKLRVNLDLLLRVCDAHFSELGLEFVARAALHALTSFRRGGVIRMLYRAGRADFQAKA